MRSKNILPVQVVSASNLMGGSHSAHKAVFEEALHSSIESSLRSAASAPSSVFSTLFFTLRQPPSPTQQDIKPSAEQLDEQITKHATSDKSNLALVPLPKPSTTLFSRTNTEAAALQVITTLQSKDGAQPHLSPHVHNPLLGGEHSMQSGARAQPPRPPIPLLTQQQQIEQLQRFKQLQRLHVWQHLHKEQQGKSPGVQPRLPLSGDLFNTPPSSSTHVVASEMRKLPVPIASLNSPINGMHGNNGGPLTRPSLDARGKPFSGAKPTQGFCKAGKDIRLTTFEHDTSGMAAFPFTYALLCLQTNPRAPDSGVLIIVALNLKSLPPPNTSAQALSAQCIGCGEKALHTFSQLADHLSLDPTVDLTSPRLATNSSQLVGAHARFYLVKDPKAPSNLIRGPPILWNKLPEGSLQPSFTPNQLQPRPILPPPAPSARHPPSTTSTLHNAIYRLHSQGQHALSSRTISGQIQQRTPVDVMKHSFPQVAPEAEATSSQTHQPRRYLINNDTSSLSPVEISQDLAASVQRKPVVVLVCPGTNQPRFTGDTSNISVVSAFSESFKEPLSSIKEQLKLLDHSPLTNDLMLLITIQCIISLDADAELTKEGLCQAIVEARQNMSAHFISSLKDLKQSNILSLASMLSSASSGRVTLVMSEISVGDAISKCLQNISTSSDNIHYQLAIHVPSNPRDLQFHVVVTSKRKCRVLGEGVITAEKRSPILKQSLLSLPFSQLRLKLAGPLSSLANLPQLKLLQSRTFRAIHQNSFVSVNKICKNVEENENEIGSSLASKVLGCRGSLNFGRFTSLRFVFVLPSSPAFHRHCVDTIARSGLLSEVFKTHLPGDVLSSQVVLPMETSSKQRLASFCKQWEDPSTLLVIVQLESDLASNYADDCNILNHVIRSNAKNVVTVQCTSSPHILLTNHSRVATSNEVYCHVTTDQLTVDDQVSSENSSTSVYSKISMTFDPKFEAEKGKLLDSNYLLHTSLITCELMMQQYIASLVYLTLEQRLKKDQNDVTRHCDDILSPMMKVMTEELLGGSSSEQSEDIVILIRIPSSVLATRFHDSMIDARQHLGLEKAFEIVLYESHQDSLDISPHFVKTLKNFHHSDWTPNKLSDLWGIPAIVIYHGQDLVQQEMPRNLKYVDLRMTFDCPLYRSTIDREVALCQPFLRPVAVTTIDDDQSSPPKKRLKQSTDDEERALQVVESDDNISETATNDSEETGSETWNKSSRVDGDQGMKRRRSGESSSSSSSSSLDFVKLAMKEADLGSSLQPKQSRTERGETEWKLEKPVAILPQKIYDRLQEDIQGHPSITSLPPHPLCSWIDSLHPQLPPGSSSQEESQFYRKWSKPAPGHPDFFDGSSSSVGDVIRPEATSLDPHRFVLVTSPASDTMRICCRFLHHLNRSLVKQHEVRVYDDKENNEEVDCDSQFRTLLPSVQCRGQSQIVNSCDYLENFLQQNQEDEETVRKIVTKENSPNNSTTLSQSELDNTGEDPSGSEIYNLTIQTSELKDSNLEVKVHVPKKHFLRFFYTRDAEGRTRLVSFRVKNKSDSGIKSPIVSFVFHDPHHSLLNLSSTLRSDEEGNDDLIHFIVAKDRDAGKLEKICGDSVLVVLPKNFDFLGRGSMKFAGQILFRHFYETEVSKATDGDLLWPYFVFMDDDCVSWWCWNPPNSMLDDQSGDYSGDWRSAPLLEVLTCLEDVASGQDQFSALGLRPWSDKMKDPRFLPNNDLIQHTVKSKGGSYVAERIVTSCFMLNVSEACHVTFNHTRFNNEDVDWSLRSASSGLRIARVDDLSVAIKVMESRGWEDVPSDKSVKLMIAADSDFEPLSHHPHQLLETFLSRSASEVFTGCKMDPFHPVLCLDCYVTLGPDIFVEFSSSHTNAPSWSIDYSKEYGGLLLFCPNPDLRSDFLHEFSFIEGATVCVIGTDRSSLRHLVVKLNLEQDWHFRLTDEFQTSNCEVLGGAKTRPMYFLTGVKKSINK